MTINAIQYKTMSFLREMYLLQMIFWKTLATKSRRQKAHNETISIGMLNSHIHPSQSTMWMTRQILNRLKAQ